MDSTRSVTEVFKYAFVPADLTSAIAILEASTSGGLERDALRLSAEAHFAAGTSKEFREQQDKILNEYLVSRGGTAGTFPGMASAVEIVVLQLPSQSNNFVGISLYCDQNGKLKNLELNTRATSLVQACGHANQIFGDAFIGRYYDNEEFPWERRDFVFEDMQSDAAWVIEARNRNQGKNAATAYSTSSVLQNMLNSNNTAMINDAPKSTTMARTDFVADQPIDDNLTWSQTSDEVEIRLKLNKDVKKSDLAVKLQSKKLQITVKNDSSLTLTHPVFGIEGSPLSNSIDPDSSAWTLEKSSAGDVIVVFTLAKSKPVQWPAAFA
jgi:hypothetical protein